MISSKKKLSKKILKGIAIAIIIYITLSLVSTKIIYDRVFCRYNAPESHSHLSHTSQMLESGREFSYPAKDCTLKGYLYSAKEPKSGLIVLVPGFKAEVIEYEGVIYALLEEGFDVFAFNPTGHGESGGESSVGFSRIIEDTSSTLDFIAKSKSFSHENVFLLGHSRGGFGACCTMNDHSIVDGTICINGVNTSTDALMAYSTQYAGDFAYVNYPFLRLYESILFGSDLSGCSAAEEINNAISPVLVIQAKNDEHIPQNKFSIYSKKDEIAPKKAEFVLYENPQRDGHTSILYDKGRNVNHDIIDDITNFCNKISAQRK